MFFFGRTQLKRVSSVKLSRIVFHRLNLVKLFQNVFFNRTQSKRVSAVKICRKVLPRSNSVETFPLVEISQNVFPWSNSVEMFFFWSNSVETCFLGRNQSHCFSSVELGDIQLRAQTTLCLRFLHRRCFKGVELVLNSLSFSKSSLTFCSISLVASSYCTLFMASLAAAL